MITALIKEYKRFSNTKEKILNALRNQEEEIRDALFSRVMDNIQSAKLIKNGETFFVLDIGDNLAVFGIKANYDYYLVDIESVEENNNDLQDFKFKLDINVNYLLNEIREKYKELVKGGKHEKFS